MDIDDAESLVLAFLPPAGLSANPGEKGSHGIPVVADRLLLHDDAALREPRIIGTGFRELLASLREARHLTSVSAPPGFLLDAQIPHVPSVSTVAQQDLLLLARRLKTVPVHVNFISESHDSWSAMRISLRRSRRTDDR
jgi:hypothetical protein